MSLIVEQAILAKFSQSVAFRHSAIAPVFQTRQRRRLHARCAAEITICTPHFKLANLPVLTKCSLVCQVQQHEPGTDLVFKPHVFLSFGKVQFQQTKVKKMSKLSARANKMLIDEQILQHEPGTDLVFKPHVFPSFGKSTITANKGKKQMPKLSARAN